MSEQPAIVDPLDDLGVDRWHPFRADCEKVQEHCRHRRYDEAAEHMLRLASQYRDAWGRNRDEWKTFALLLEAAVLPDNPLGQQMLRDACAKIARGRVLSRNEKRLERIPMLGV